MNNTNINLKDSHDQKATQTGCNILNVKGLNPLETKKIAELC